MNAGTSEISSFRDLRVWQAAMDVAEAALTVCDAEPLSKKFRLAGQLESAASSIPANIAEGHSSGSTNISLKHLYIARGSLAETLTFLELFGRTKLIAKQKAASITEMLDPVARMLNALIKSLEKKEDKGRKPRP